MKANELVFSFDTGLQTGGEAVRSGGKFIYAASNEIDKEYGSIENDRKKRRLKRQRYNYHARIDWLNQQCKYAGIPVHHNLQKISKDKFTDISTPEDKKIMSLSAINLKDLAKTGDHRVLRTFILEGHFSKLEPWQIYVALHGAIRKRGYQHVPWASDLEKEESGKDKGNSPKSLKNQFEDSLRKVIPEEKYQYTCYYELYIQGIWNPKNKKFNSDVDFSNLLPKAEFNQSGEQSGYTSNRETVLNELKVLLAEVKKHFSKLDIDLTIFGPCRFELKENSDLVKLGTLKNLYEKEVQGILGQKIPRFSNRIISKCTLFPHLNVVQKTDPLTIKFHYYYTLYNYRYLDYSTGEVRKISCTELKKIAQYCLDCKLHEKGAKDKSLSNILKELPELGLDTVMRGDKLALPNLSGRSRFSRPALYFLIQFFERGDETLKDFYSWCIDQPTHFSSKLFIKDNADPMKGLRHNDFFWLEHLSNENRTWHDFYIPNVTAMISKNPEERYKEILKGIKHPLIRQRAILFRQRLKKLSEFSKSKVEKGVPDKIIIELVREDFSVEKKKDVTRIQGEIADENRRLLQKALDACKSEKAKTEILKNRTKFIRLFKLAEQQDYTDLFSSSDEKTFSPRDLVNLKYDFAHIVPDSKGGTRELRNLILMRPEQNRDDQKNRTFYDWLNPLNKWKSFTQSVKFLKNMPKHKKELLLSKNPVELFSKNQGLFDTSYVSSAFRQIASLEFGWNNGIDSQGNQRVFLVRGKITGWFRGGLGLNKLLSTENKKISTRKEITTTKIKKTREKDSDPRNHGLDAMCLSYLANINEMKELDNFMSADSESAELKRQRVREQIVEGFENVLFVRRLSKPKGNIEENFYGVHRQKNSNKIFITRSCTILDAAYGSDGFKKVFKVTELLKKLGLKSDKKFNPQILTEKYLELSSKNLKDKEFIESLFSKKTGCPIYTSLKDLYDSVSSEDSKKQPAKFQKLASSFTIKTGSHKKILRKIILIERECNDETELGELKIIKYKDGSGEYCLKPKGSHLGFIIYKSKDNKEILDRVYVHEGEYGTLKRLNIDKSTPYIIFQTGDRVRITKKIDAELLEGTYKFKTADKGSLVLEKNNSVINRSIRLIGLSNIEKVKFPAS